MTYLFGRGFDPLQLHKMEFRKIKKNLKNLQISLKTDLQVFLYLDDTV